MATKTQENGSAATKSETTKTVIAENRGGWSLRRKKKNKQTSVDTPPRSQSADNLSNDPDHEGDVSVITESFPATPTADSSQLDTDGTATPVTANGDMKAGSDGSGSMKTPPTERKASKLSAFSRIFKPWKWRKRKKTSEKLEKTAIDLERKISVRTSREELIKRGVLKEVDENGDPIIPREAPINEEDETDLSVEEAAGDDKSDSEYKQANGSAATTPTLPAHAIDPNMTNSITGSCDTGDSGDMVAPPTDNAISLSPEYHPRPASNPVTVTHYGADHSNYHGDEIQQTESVVVEPKQIRVMLPVGVKDRQVPVIQKIPVTHEPPDYTPSPPPDHHHHQHPLHSPVVVSSSYNHSPMLNNNIYSPTGITPTGHTTAGLMYPTPTFKSQTLPIKVNGEAHYLPTTPIEVPISEPDLDKKPLRSAMKGGKSKQLLQQQLQQKLQQRQQQYGMYNHDGSLHRTGPKVAPKPKVSLVNAMRDNKENFGGPDYDNLYSDSDEEVQYDDRDRESILAARVQRQDSLAKFLNHRPDRRHLIERNILHGISDNERQRERDLIGNRLTRRLSLRPTAEELENRNILHSIPHEQYMKEKEEKKRVLIRKLSFRPSVEELQGRKIILFSDYVETSDANEYDRRADKPWTRLTPKDKAAIRKELNQFKSSEMDVHDESRHLTRFHRP